MIDPLADLDADLSATEAALAPLDLAHVLPADVWNSHPVLGLIRDHATASLVPPDLVLGWALAATSLGVPAGVALPSIIGGHVALNFGVVMIGPTGTGKSASRGAFSIATTDDHGRLNRPRWLVRSFSTGPGIVEALCGTEADEHGYRHAHGEPVMFHADEGRRLEAEHARRESTLVATLAEVLLGESPGTANATPGLRRHLDPLTFPAAVVIGLQPAYLSGPLADYDGGLPQRFAFVHTHGENLTADPPPRPSEPLVIRKVNADTLNTDRGVRVIDVPDSITAELRVAHCARSIASGRGEPVARSSHRGVLRLKVAALLSILCDGRGAVETWSWDTAGTIVDTSDAVLAIGDRARAFAAADSERKARERAGSHAAAGAAAVADEHAARIERVAAVIARRVWNATGGASRRDIARALRAHDRPMTVEALAHADALGWIVSADDGSAKPGDEKPPQP